jgi:hypothetical protein
MVDINMPLPIPSDDEDGENKIIKEAENKISKSSATCQFKDLLWFFQLKVSKKDFGNPLCMHSLRNDLKLSTGIIKRGLKALILLLVV